MFTCQYLYGNTSRVDTQVQQYRIGAKALMEAAIALPDDANIRTKLAGYRTLITAQEWQELEEETGFGRMGGLNPPAPAVAVKLQLDKGDDAGSTRSPQGSRDTQPPDEDRAALLASVGGFKAMMIVFFLVSLFAYRLFTMRRPQPDVHLA